MTTTRTRKAKRLAHHDCPDWCHCRICGGFKIGGVPYGPSCICPEPPAPDMFAKPEKSDLSSERVAPGDMPDPRDARIAELEVRLSRTEWDDPEKLGPQLAGAQARVRELEEYWAKYSEEAEAQLAASRAEIARLTEALMVIDYAARTRGYPMPTEWCEIVRVVRDALDPAKPDQGDPECPK